MKMSNRHKQFSVRKLSHPWKNVLLGLSQLSGSNFHGLIGVAKESISLQSQSKCKLYVTLRGHLSLPALPKKGYVSLLCDICRSCPALPTLNPYCIS